MENKNTKLKNFLSGIAFGFVVVALLATTVGCGKKDKGNANPYRSRYSWNGGGYGYGGGGYGYNGNVAAGFEANGQYMLILENNGTQVMGELELFNGIGCTNSPAGLAPGIYQITSTQPNMGQNGLISTTVMASGPGGQAQIQIYASTFAMSMVCNRFAGLYGQMNIISVNGQYCGSYSSFQDYTPNQQMCNGF